MSQGGGGRKGENRGPANTTRHDTSASASTTGVTMGDANVQQVGGQLARLTLSTRVAVIIMDSVGNGATEIPRDKENVLQLKDHIVTKYSGQGNNPQFATNHIKVYERNLTQLQSQGWKEWSLEDAKNYVGAQKTVDDFGALNTAHCYLAIVDVPQASDLPPRIADLPVSIWTVVIMDSVGNDAMRADAGVHYVCDLKDHIVTKYSGQGNNPQFATNHIEVYGVAQGFQDEEETWGAWTIQDAKKEHTSTGKLKGGSTLNAAHCYLAIVDPIMDALRGQLVPVSCNNQEHFDLTDEECERIHEDFIDRYNLFKGKVDSILSGKILPGPGFEKEFQIVWKYSIGDTCRILTSWIDILEKYRKDALTLLQDIYWEPNLDKMFQVFSKLKDIEGTKAIFSKTYAELPFLHLLIPCLIHVRDHMSESQARICVFAPFLDHLLEDIPGHKLVREYFISAERLDETNRSKFVDIALVKGNRAVLLVEEKAEEKASNFSISVPPSTYSGGHADLVKSAWLAHDVLASSRKDIPVFVIIICPTRMDLYIVLRVSPNYFVLEPMVQRIDPRDYLQSISTILALRRMIGENTTDSSPTARRATPALNPTPLRGGSTGRSTSKGNGNGKGKGNDNGKGNGNDNDNGPGSSTTKCQRLASAPAIPGTTHFPLASQREENDPPSPPRSWDVPRSREHFFLEKELVHTERTRIWRAKDAYTNEEVILKFLRVHFSQQEHELSMHMECAAHAPHVLPILHTFWDADGWGDSYRVLVLPSLRSLPSLPPRDLITLAQCILKALRGIHRRRIAHLDVKPSNILMSLPSPNASTTFFLSDFGCAQSISEGLSYAGTEGFIAPELDDGYEGCDESCDCYSLGMTLLHLLQCMTPPHPFLIRSSYYIDEGDTCNIPFLEKVAHDNILGTDIGLLCRVALGLLDWDPASRLTTEEALHLLDAADSNSSSSSSPSSSSSARISPIMESSTPSSSARILTPHLSSNVRSKSEKGGRRVVFRPKREKDLEKENAAPPSVLHVQ